MNQPRFRAYEPKTTMPFFSTRSLAIASLVVAGCGIITALSPLLFPPFQKIEHDAGGVGVEVRIVPNPLLLGVVRIEQALQYVQNLFISRHGGLR